MKNSQLILVAGLLFGLLLLLLGVVVIWGWIWASAHAPDNPPGMQEEYVQISPQSMQPYPELLSFDYDQIGFPPLPTKGEVRILIVDRANWQKLNGSSPPNYDVSFQIYDTSNRYLARFVALKGTPGAYQVVSNQVTYQGPLSHVSDPDSGPQPEFISITNEKQQVAVAGASLQGTEIRYDGPDPRLKNATQPLTPADIGPILREWGYDYKIDLASAGP